MSSFTSPLVVKIHSDNPQEREIYLEFYYYRSDGTIITVPKGFRTNFASTPRFLWWLLPPLDHYGKASVIHDYLYRTPSVEYTRKQADDILKEACEVLKVKKWKIWMLFCGVRTFGFRSYRKYRKH
jgi:hypothetical protein